MQVKDLIMAGKLKEARKMLVDQLKASPANTQARTLLFQILVINGEWDKALNHIEMLATQSNEPGVSIDVYRNLIAAEKERFAVSQLKKIPSFLPETPSYWEDYVEALKLISESKSEEAIEKIKAVDKQRPVVTGTLNDTPFTGFFDTDSALSCFIEAIEYERYLWIPIESIRELVVSAPETLMDLIWAKARVTTWGGLTMGCFLPAIYPHSFSSEDEHIKMGFVTDWQTLCGPFTKACGRHVYQVGDDDYELFQLGEVTFNMTDAKKEDE